MELQTTDAIHQSAIPVAQEEEVYCTFDSTVQCDVMGRVFFFSELQLIHTHTWSASFPVSMHTLAQYWPDKTDIVGPTLQANVGPWYKCKSGLRCTIMLALRWANRWPNRWPTLARLGQPLANLGPTCRHIKGPMKICYQYFISFFKCSHVMDHVNFLSFETDKA